MTSAIASSTTFFKATSGACMTGCLRVGGLLQGRLMNRELGKPGAVHAWTYTMRWDATFRRTLIEQTQSV